jgi:subtilisin family serine protease
MFRTPHSVLPLALAVALAGARSEGQPLELARDAGAPPGDGPARILVAGDPASLAGVAGLELGTCLAGLCTAAAWPWEIDLDRLAAVAAIVEPPARRRPLLERSLPMAGVTEELRDTGLDGEGVLVVVIDSGIDWRHLDFSGEASDHPTTRIEHVADLSLPPAGAHPELEARIGAAVWSRADIEAHLAAEEEGETPVVAVEERDLFGHGTHVASVAAGGRGVAPGASIIAVRVSRADWPVVFEDADVLDAARFGFELAGELAMPAVVVLSLGGHEGPHDGTSLLEQGLGDLVGPEHPGRVIVVAAGNSGGCQDHAVGDARRGPVDLALEVSLEDPSLAVDLELWSPETSALGLAVTTPDGERTAAAAPGESLSWAADAAWIGVANAPDGPDERNGDRLATVSLRPQLAGPVAPGRYVVTVEGSGRFDAYLTWATDARVGSGARLLTHLAPDGTLTVPGTSEELIVVGASVSRRGWTDDAGRSWLDERYEVAGIAPYSGSGPARSGALKPDLVAPGHAVIAAMSRDAPAGSDLSVFTPASGFVPDDYLVAPPGDRAVLTGTSVAAPHVAGVAALLLQLDPGLTQDEVRALLVASARTDGGARGRAWSPRWGFGEVDAAAAVALLRAGFDDEASADPARCALGVERDVVAPGECAAVTVVPRDDEGRPLGPGRLVEVTATTGTVAPAAGATDGVYTSEWCAGDVGPGIVSLSAEVDGVLLEREATIRVAVDRQHLGAWATASGGCDAAGPAPTILPGLVLQIARILAL